MQKQYFNTIRTGTDHPFLGVFKGQVHTWDAATVGPKVEILDIGKGVGKYRTKNRDALVGHKSIKCVITNDLDAETLAILETLPNLEQVQLSHRPISPSLNLAGLVNCRFVLLNDVRKLESLDLVAEMPALKSLFVRGPKSLDFQSLTTLNLEELALWCFLPGTQLSPLFSQTELEYLCVGGFKPPPVEFTEFKKLTRLQQIELNSISHPFEVYAGLDGILPDVVKRNWRILFRLPERCDLHQENHLLQAPGTRQKSFCELCEPKRLKRLFEKYKAATGLTLNVPI